MNCLKRSRTCELRPVHTPLTLKGALNWSTSKAFPLTERLMTANRNVKWKRMTSYLCSRFLILTKVPLRNLLTRPSKLDRVPSLIFTSTFIKHKKKQLTLSPPAWTQCQDLGRSFTSFGNGRAAFRQLGSTASLKFDLSTKRNKGTAKRDMPHPRATLNLAMLRVAK